MLRLIIASIAEIEFQLQKPDQFEAVICCKRGTIVTRESKLILPQRNSHPIPSMFQHIGRCTTNLRKKILFDDIHIWG